MALPDYDVYTAEIVNSSIGSANPAFITVTFGGAALGATDPEILATNIVAFLARCSMAVGSSVAGVTRRRSVDSGGTPIDFDATYWAALKAVDAGLPAATSYGVDLGSGPLLPRGTSCLIMEYSETPGRSATGRMNVPYLPQGALNATGEISTSVQTAVVGSYNSYLLRDGSNSAVLPVGVDPGPLVVSKSTLTAHSIRTPVVSPLPSRFRSRQR